MTPEEKSLLERTHKLAEDNNAMLHSIRRASRISAAFRIVYWVIIIVTGAAAYYFIQPYLTMMLSLYDQAKSGVTSGANTIQGGMNTVQNAADSIRELLK